MMASSSFDIYDYLVFAIMLAVSAAIGVYYRFTGGQQKTTKEYMMAGRNMSIIPVGFSLMASFMSAITLLGVSMENYSYGTQFVIINISYGLATPIAAYGYLPVFYKLQATSAHEYLERRFGVATRLAASCAFMFQMILYMSIVLYAPALALSAVMGISQLGAILSVGIVCTFYSTIGGMKAVLVTDVFQSFLMFAAIYCVIIKGSIDAGGLDKVWKIAQENSRIEFFNFQPDPTIRNTSWSLVIGGMFTYLSVYAANQTQIQRLLTVKSLKKSQQAMWLNWPIVTALSLSTSLSGIVIFSRYYNCDPLKEGRISSADQLLPLFVMDSMGHLPGLIGLFVAGIFSGSLSTVSSAVNSLAAVTLEDFAKPFLKHKGYRPISDEMSTVISKFLALFYGGLCVAMAFLTDNLGGLLQASLTTFGVVGGPLFGLFTLGMFFWISNQAGALCGLLSGLAISLWLGFGGPKPPPPYLPTRIDGCNTTHDTTTYLVNATLDALSGSEKEYFYLYRLSYLWCVVIGFCVTLLVGLMTSVIYQKICPVQQDPLDPDLFSPLIKRFIPENNEQFIRSVVPADSNMNTNSKKDLPEISEQTFNSNHQSSVNTVVSVL